MSQLSKLLNLTRPLVVPDVETTGLDTNVARIVELGFQVHRPGDKPVVEYRTLVDPGITIPKETVDVHGIHDHHVLACRVCETGRLGHEGSDHDFKPWPKFKDLAANLATGFSNCDFAGKNVRFDLKMLTAEFARAGVIWSIGDARILDADRLEALLFPRTLSHLYEKYAGKPLDDAHQALADVRATTLVLEQQLFQRDEYGVARLPMDLDALHQLQWPGMIDLEGKFQFDKDGTPCFSRWGKYSLQPMTKADVGYWDFILTKDFAPETKAIAAKAKMGQYPERKK